MLYIVILYYIEDRMKWGMIVVNMHQEKWMQINDFILNNIPENIMILDLQGQTKFISDYCKSFLRKCHLSLDTQELFQKIKDLSEQPPTEPTSPTFVTLLCKIFPSNLSIRVMNLVKLKDRIQ